MLSIKPLDDCRHCGDKNAVVTLRTEPSTGTIVVLRVVLPRLQRTNRTRECATGQSLSNLTFLRQR